ncbi:MAG: hypothetical protein ACKVN9_07080 [Methylophilaceae bacterium]
MTKLIGWARLCDRAFSAADKVGGRAPQGAETGAINVADVALATRVDLLMRPAGVLACQHPPDRY